MCRPGRTGLGSAPGDVRCTFKPVRAVFSTVLWGQPFSIQKRNLLACELFRSCCSDWSCRPSAVHCSFLVRVDQPPDWSILSSSRALDSDSEGVTAITGVLLKSARDLLH
jgi:hypothetical protein